MIYEHFGSKEGLYRQVVENDPILDSITEALSTEAKPCVLGWSALHWHSWLHEERTDGFGSHARRNRHPSPRALFSTLLSHVTARVEHLLSDEFARRGFSAADGAMYAQMLVVVAMTGQWWLDSREPDKRPLLHTLSTRAWKRTDRL